jgi:hypothetical protein
MGTLVNQTNFTILSTAPYSETAELVLLPENDGTLALRELHYPNDALPRIIYEQNPDTWENFDTFPLTGKPLVQVDQTLTGNVISRWQGYVADLPVIERWVGNDTQSHMYLYFLRRLWEYFSNPPSVGYISWYPKDRTETGYYVEMENLTVGGSALSLDYIPLRNNLVMGEVQLTLRIISEVS